MLNQSLILTRSIPAPAGEPWRTWVSWSIAGVYPRACGGTARWHSLPQNFRGLSPRLRGNQHPQVVGQSGPGSIPAPAGEPAPAGCWPEWTGVYPRACGGTAVKIVERGQVSGLSPRLRGNRHLMAPGKMGRGAIPAPAGEPEREHRQSTHTQVYPRACGGTGLWPVGGLVPNGLSPRLRGNLVQPESHRCGVRSIPAPAGEPRFCRREWLPMTVYPRACGGTVSYCRINPTTSGLSPRLRGNLSPGLSNSLSHRSIPAPAGEPARLLPVEVSPRVYPRACGGTFHDSRRQVGDKGLSPRLRGNQPVVLRFSAPPGSIPAPAGEPVVLCRWVPTF